MRIGEIATNSGVNVQTLRYYERRGLIGKPRRTESGYRDYPAKTVSTVRSIKRAQSLGFTLEEIRELMGIRAARRNEDVLILVQDKRAEIDAKLRDLRRMRRALDAVVEQCACGGDVSRCDVLAELARE